MTVAPPNPPPAEGSGTPRALVVFESMFGNTETIAEAVADGLSPAMSVELVEVGDAPAQVQPPVALLVVGGPTHALGLSRPATRREAAGQTEGVVSKGPGLREWLDALPPAAVQVPAAAFDTRIDKPRVPGSAARAAARRLRRLGFHLVEPAESFYVGDSTGPLVAGEAQRARRWGEGLAAAVCPRPGREPAWRGGT